MSEISYTRASGKHCQFLIDSRVAFLSEYLGKPDPSVEQKFRDELKLFFEKEIPLQSYCSWLAMDAGKWIAVGGMKIIQKPGNFLVPDGRCGYIMNMYTLPEYRKQGIAMKLLHKLMEDGKALGINFFELHASKDGEPMYVKEGFQLHNEPTYRKYI